MKLKRIYKVLIILVVVILIGLLLTIGLKNLLFSNSGSYNRKEGIADISAETLNNINNSLLENEFVKDATSRVSDKSPVLTISIQVSSDTKEEQAKNLSTNILEKLSDEDKNNYDIQIILTKENDEKFSTMGYKPNDSESFSWANKNIGGTDEA